MLQHPDTAFGDRGVQLHVGAIESRRGVVEETERERSVPFEVREASLEQEGDRIGPRHALARDPSGRRPSRGPEPATGTVLRRHGQPAASLQVQRFDPQDLDPPEMGAAEDAIQVLEQAPRQRSVAPVERGLIRASIAL